MTKREIIRYLQEKYNAKKALFKEYDLIFTHQDQEYVVKIFNVGNTNQVTINSTRVWEIKSGRVDGVRYKASSGRLIDLGEFQKHQNKIILFTNTPYRVLKYLNESDLVDVSHEHLVHNIYYFDSVAKIDSIL